MKFDIAKQYAGDEDVAGSADESEAAAELEPITFTADQVAEMQALKDSGDMEGLGKYVAEYL